MIPEQEAYFFGPAVLQSHQEVQPPPPHVSEIVLRDGAWRLCGVPSTNKLGKNYYVIRRPSSGECSVVPKKVPNDFVMVSKSPYAGEQYTKAAIETFPELHLEQRRAANSSPRDLVSGSLDYL